MILNDLPFVRALNSHKLIAKHYAKLQSKSMKHNHKDYDDFRNAQGFLGEVILAQMLDCLPSWRILKDEATALEKTWDGGFDLEYKDTRIDVKTTAFRNPNAIDKLNVFCGCHGGSDIYIQMLFDESEFRRENGLNSIDWINKVWCAGYAEAGRFSTAPNGRLKFPIKDLTPITYLGNG